MGLFTPFAEVLARVTQPAPAPTYTPIQFANVGEALLAIHRAQAMGPGVAICIAQTFARTAADRLGLTEAGVWDALLTAHPDLTGALWSGSMWNALATELFGNLGITVEPTLH
jgi:hypothetical protein